MFSSAHHKLRYVLLILIHNRYDQNFAFKYVHLKLHGRSSKRAMRFRKKKSFYQPDKTQRGW